MLRTKGVSVWTLFILLASLGLAQEFRATISGRVLDATGAFVPNAKVVATNVANNETNEATTNTSGA